MDPSEPTVPSFVQTLTKMKAKFGVIGAGNMAQAIMFPLFEKGILDPQIVMVSARTNGENLQAWKAYGCHTTTDNGEVLIHSLIIMWAVKPNVFPQAISSINASLQTFTEKGIPEGLGTNHPTCRLFLSVMAGIPVEQICSAVSSIYGHQGSKSEIRVARIMPNIGLKVYSGVAVYAVPEHGLSQEDRSTVEELFQPLGLCYEVPESQINAYCGLFGSGIGFMFPILEALSDGAVKLGIPRQRSIEIAAQVMKGAGELVLHDKLHPGVLKDKVCSPGGTTIAGIAELEKGGIRTTVISAVEAATKRGDEIAEASRKPSIQ